MLHTTFRKAKDAKVCIASYYKMAKALGGVQKYGKDTPIPLDKVVEICGPTDAIWSLRCTNETSENFLIEFACRCAERVLHFYEELYHNDERPRQAIEKARICIIDKSVAARSAAESAAWSAASAARAAARAARSAAREAR